jgi:hypothetical protein
MHAVRRPRTDANGARSNQNLSGFALGCGIASLGEDTKSGNRRRGALIELIGTPAARS